MSELIQIEIIGDNGMYQYDMYVNITHIFKNIHSNGYAMKLSNQSNRSYTVSSKSMELIIKTFKERNTCKECTSKDKIISQLTTHISLTPGGTEYLKAQTHFESRNI